MNTQVTASNMQVRAVAEKGLLINEVADYDDQNWDNEAISSQTASTPTDLYPTSTNDGVTWYHNASKLEDDAAGNTAGTSNANLVGSYETFSNLPKLTSTGIGAAAIAGTNAERNVYGKTASDTIGYYVVYSYYLKSSASEIGLGKETNKQNVLIKEVKATTTTALSANLNPCVRVGIKLKNEFYIYAPISGAVLTYYVGGSSDATVAKAGDVSSYTDLDKLPSSATDGTQVDIYIWFEGEDPACKSSFAQSETLDALQVKVTFELGTVVAA